MTAPSRDFMIRQASLTAVQNCHGDFLALRPPDHRAYLLRALEESLQSGHASYFERAVRKEFAKIAAQYSQEAA